MEWEPPVITTSASPRRIHSKASPIAWEHHYGVLFPVYAVLLISLLRSPARLGWLVVSYVLASNYFIATQLLAPTSWNVLQSYLLIAAGILLVLLHLSPPARATVLAGSPDRRAPTMDAKPA